MGAPLYDWPWQNMGALKYLLYGPFVAQVARVSANGEDIGSSWCFHILLLCALRGSLHTFWSSYCNMYFLTDKRRIVQQGFDFNQIDQEWDWDNFLILQAFVGALACYITPCLRSLPMWDTKGMITALILHIVFSEPLCYFLHKKLHGEFLFSRYHSLHHSSPVPTPFTAEHATYMEHLLMIPIIGVPVLATSLFGHGSVGLVYGYILGFDFLRCLGQSNAEILPHQIFEAFPPLRYLLYTPTYHSLHHTEKDSNYCLFMPLFDALGNTLNNKSWDLHKQLSLKAASKKYARVPEFVFLAHIGDFSGAAHAQFIFRSFSSMAFRMRLFVVPLMPLSFVSMLGMWAWATTFATSFYNLRNKLHATWTVPRYGFQYFLPFAARGINKQIELAILKADRIGVKVISLAGLNKNESLNGGGVLFVNMHPNLRVRVVHGNTLTAAVILHEIPEGVKELFLTGSTSKLGRAIALYLCSRNIRVLMLTQSTERFQKIQKEAPVECQKYLVQVTKYQEAKHCKTWIVGKWITQREQMMAPPGTHFHQFVVPPILNFRRDCTYGDLAALKLPQDVQGLSVCEYTLGRGAVHACHAGGVVHFLEGWSHHEVGAIDVDQIDVAWEAALKHGFKPVWS